MHVEPEHLWSIALAWLVTVSLMVLIRPLALGFGLVDHPGGRKFHEETVPVFGGIAMFVGCCAGFALIDFDARQLLAGFAASSLLLVAGIFDDRFSIPVGLRFPPQVGAVLIMIYVADLSLADMGAPFGTGIIQTGRFEFLFTLLVSVAMINAYNFVDGVDGLAGLLAILALLPVAVVSGLGSDHGIAALIVAAAVGGFLTFNFPVPWNRRLRAFMGDAGSTLLGFAIVWITIGISQGSERTISPVHCLWFAALPIFDFFTCFVQRIVRGKTPFTPGRDHMHHILQRGGFSVQQRLAILVGMQSFYSMVGIAGHYSGAPDVLMFAAWSLLGLSQAAILRQVSKRHRLRFKIRR